MQRALLASLMVGLVAPAVGVFLVQRRLSLLGDGLGHVALTGVAIGVLTSTAPVGTALVIGAVVLLGQRLYAVSDDEEYARAVGLPVLGLNVVLAVLVASTVVLSMRVVGLLLISALMIVPSAVAQLVGRSFRQTVLLACAIGLVTSVAGTT